MRRPGVDRVTCALHRWPGRREWSLPQICTGGHAQVDMHRTLFSVFMSSYSARFAEI